MIAYLEQTFGNLENAAHFSTVVSSIVVVVSLLVLVVQVGMAHRKEAMDRECGTYLTLAGEWEKFLTFCADNPNLDIYDVENKDISELAGRLGLGNDTAEAKKTLVAYSKLTSMMEVAFLMYGKQDSSVKRDQWAGWDAFIKMHFARNSFYNIYPEIGGGFSRDFEAYMSQLHSAATREREVLK